MSATYTHQPAEDLDYMRRTKAELKASRSPKAKAELERRALNRAAKRAARNGGAE